MKNTKTPREQGFTLVELAIGLIIVGLLTGGILAGQHLIRASELESVLPEAQRYVSATQNFKAKYNYLPGDMPNATTFWAEVAPGCTTAAGTNDQTCNGNGNGQVSSPSADYYERHRYWQHLALSGMIEGSFTGFQTGAAAISATPGINTPENALGAGYQIIYLGTLAANTAWNAFAGKYDHTYTIGFNAPNNAPVIAFLTPLEMLQIDEKFDNGMPGTGIVRSLADVNTPGRNCSDGTVAITAQYDLTQNSLECIILFVTGL